MKTINKRVLQIWDGDLMDNGNLPEKLDLPVWSFSGYGCSPSPGTEPLAECQQGLPNPALPVEGRA